MGDEVQPGSVLLPASRRGRYLANIIRRQAVDGTGIKFNKDADRMNAEAKKKVDVLSEELLPYIIAEQERRTTLYKRVMTAIQNGEKGVTIAEIRNKPPAIIRKGLMYRCPTNRAPREPDGSGAIMCEANLDPTPIMFESCLSAEDKELYVAENKYFFCNRHKVEGPDLPRNGTSVIGCSPCERTSLNYTSQKCALEDTDDVVVHYRYYPDRTYKFVSELDPDREVCEHWNPCQVGYIFSLPGPDQATPASELWQDDKNETTIPAQGYTTSTRRLRIPEGYEYHGVGKYLPNGLRARVSRRDGNFDNIEVITEVIGAFIKIKMIFHPMRAEDATTYYVRFEDNARRGNFIHIPLVTLSMGQTRLTPQVLLALPAQHHNSTNIYFTCARCVLRGIMLRATDGSVRNVDVDKYRLRKFHDEQSVIDLDTELITPRDFGDYFLMIQNDDGGEERIKALTLNAIQAKRLRVSASVGMHVDQSMTYTCADCELTDVLCRGESVLAQGRVALISTSKSVNINFVGFEDTNACVYMGIFKIGDATYRKIVAVLDSITIDGGAILLPPPAEGAFFEHKVHYRCSTECSLTKVTVNGIPLETTTRRSNVGSVAYYLPEDTAVRIGITEYTSSYEGVVQGVFLMDGEQITKNLLEIGFPAKEETTPTPQSLNNAEPQAEPESDVKPESEAEPESESDTEPKMDPKPEGETKPDTDPKSDAEMDPKIDPKSEGETKPETDPKPDAGTVPNTDLKPEGEKASNTDLEPEGETAENEPPPDRRRKLQPSSGTRRSEGTGQSCSVSILRDSVPAGHAYKQKTVGYACPGGRLVTVVCRGQKVTAGLDISTNNIVNIDFDRFEDTNACVYMGIFKLGQTKHKKTLAVIEMINVTVSTVVPPPPSGVFKHKVVYTCIVATCNPAMIYINDKTLKSDDKNPYYSYTSEMVKGSDKEITMVTINFSIKPFTKEYEGVYQLVVTNGTERVTKNIMEIGALV